MRNAMKPTQNETRYFYSIIADAPMKLGIYAIEEIEMNF